MSGSLDFVLHAKCIPFRMYLVKRFQQLPKIVGEFGRHGGLNYTPQKQGEQLGMADDKRKENLNKWKTGQSGNPTGGKGVRRDLIKEIEHLLATRDPWDEQKRCWADTLVQKLLWMCV